MKHFYFCIATDVTAVAALLLLCPLIVVAAVFVFSIVSVITRLLLERLLYQPELRSIELERMLVDEV